MFRLASILFLCFCLTCSASYTVVSGGQRTTQSQTILPAKSAVDYLFDVSLSYVDDNEYATTPSTTNDDVVITNHRTVPSKYSAVSLDILNGHPRPATFSLNSNSASRLSVDYLVDGGVCETVTVTAVSGGKTVSKDFDLSGTFTNSYAFVDGSLGAEMSDEIQSRVDLYGYTTNTQPLFVDAETGWTALWRYPHGHPQKGELYERTVVRNTNSWVRDIDLTCASPWNSYDYSWRAGTLITDKHMVNAAHFDLPINTTVVFIGQDNSAYSNVISKKQSIAFDLMLYEFTESVSTNISPCKILGASYTNHFGMESGWNRATPEAEVPLIFSDQKALIQRGFWRDRPNLFTTTPTAVDKDSGQPLFSIVDGEAVLLTQFFSAEQGSAYYANVSNINSQISAWGGTQTATTVNLNEFTNY